MYGKRRYTKTKTVRRTVAPQPRQQAGLTPAFPVEDQRVVERVLTNAEIRFAADLGQDVTRLCRWTLGASIQGDRHPAAIVETLEAFLGRCKEALALAIRSNCGPKA